MDMQVTTVLRVKGNGSVMVNDYKVATVNTDSKHF